MTYSKSYNEGLVGEYDGILVGEYESYMI